MTIFCFPLPPWWQWNIALNVSPWTLYTFAGLQIYILDCGIVKEKDLLGSLAMTGFLEEINVKQILNVFSRGSPSKFWD